MNYQGWNNFTLFFSASFSQSVLKNSYQKQNYENAEQKSYENCYPFMYYLEHGKIYYQQASKAPLIIQPILLFYGFVHLIKACILIKDPNYPETTSVLAHGVSSRKRKKRQYLFLEDDVKLQKTGLFPFMSDKLFHMKHLEGNKVTMEELLLNIPELCPLFFQLENKKTFERAQYENGSFYLSNKILDLYHMTENRFEDYLRLKYRNSFSVSQTGRNLLMLTAENEFFGENLPFRMNLKEKQYSFSLLKGEISNFPEMLIHYLLLYNLSMIARYETEWWSELIKMMPTNDYPFIESFLDITMSKGPYLVYEYLMSVKG